MSSKHVYKVIDAQVTVSALTNYDLINCPDVNGSVSIYMDIDATSTGTATVDVIQSPDGESATTVVPSQVASPFSAIAGGNNDLISVDLIPFAEHIGLRVTPSGGDIVINKLWLIIK